MRSFHRFRSTRRGFRGSRGVTVIEYALGIAMLAVPVTVTVANLEDTQNDHLESEGERIGNPDGMGLSQVATTTPAPTTTAATTTTSPTSSSTTSTSTTTTSTTSTSTTSTSVPSPPITTTTLPTIGAMHVSEIEVSARVTGIKWSATVVITIRDQTGALVAGAEVQGEWTPAAAANDLTCTTETAGECTVTQRRMPSAEIPTATYTIHSITHPELVHDPAADETPLTVSISPN